MKKSYWIRRAHKWLGLLVGLQALLWMVSGVYMTVVPLETIHGDHLAHPSGDGLAAVAPRLHPDALAQRYPGMTAFRLKSLLGREVYEVRQGSRIVLADAATGLQLSPLREATVRELADALHHGEGTIRKIEWLTKLPQEVATRKPPLWAVHYDEPGDTTLYFSADSGELVARRHSLWRWFDFLWMFHIMDYETRDDVNNTLLRVAAVSGLLFALSGAWLLFYSFSRRRLA